MQTNSWVKHFRIIAAGAFITSMMFAAPVNGAEQQKPAGKPEIPEGYVLVNQETLRRMVHEEVTRQLQAIAMQMQKETQQREAAGRFQSMISSATMLRAQVALYRLQHNDNAPSLEQMGDGFKFLTVSTDAAGRRSTADQSYGPYLMRPLTNPVTGKSKVELLGKATAEAGWSYDPQTGMVKAVLPKQLQSQLKDKFNPRDIEFAAAE